MSFKKIFPALIGLAALVLAFAFFKFMVSSKPKPQREAPKPHPVSVRYQNAERVDTVILVRGAGTVIPAQQIELAPQVSGRILSIAEQLIPGGLVRKGERLIEVETVEYEFALDQAKANLAAAELKLKEEEGRAVVASSEWALLGQEITSDPAGRDLVLRQPQMRQAESARDAALSAVRQAERNLQRTQLTAPFNAMVRRKNIDPGQLVTPQTSVATLVGTDSFWVRASVPIDDLRFIHLPDRKGNGGAKAKIRLNTEGEPIVKEGRVIRLLPDVEESGRLARVLIEVRDPLGIEQGRPGEALLLGTFVNAEIEGITMPDVVNLPTFALREGNNLWLVNEQNQLEVRSVVPVWRQNDMILLNDGIKVGERVILTPMANPLPGMNLLAVENGDLENHEKPGETVETADEKVTPQPETRPATEQKSGRLSQSAGPDVSDTSGGNHAH